MSRRLFSATLFGICVALPCLTIEFPIQPYEISIPYLTLSIFAAGYLALAKNPRRSVVNGSMVYASICVAVFLCDLIARIIVPHGAYANPVRFAFHFWPPEPTLYRYYPNVSFEGPIEGSLAAISGKTHARELRTIRFRTDSLGFRNEPDAHRNVIDTIVLGDSFGVGDGTTQDKTWSRLIQEECRRRVYNLSIQSGPRNELVTLKVVRPGLRMTPDAVVLWAIFSGNDLTDYYHDALDPHFSGPFSMAGTMLFNFRKSSPVKKLYEASTRRYENPVIECACEKREGCLFYRPEVEMMKMDVHAVMAHKNLPKLQAVIREMKRYSSETNLRVHVIFFPSKPEVYPPCEHGALPSDTNPTRVSSAFERVVEQIAVSNGLPFLDLTPDLVDAARKVAAESGELLWWRDDTHMNEKGHEIVASLICEKVFKKHGSRRSLNPPWGQRGKTFGPQTRIR